MTRNSNAGGTVPIDMEAAMLSFQGDRQLFENVARMLIAQVASDLPEIRASASRQSSRALADATHRLKGSLGAISAIPAYLACTTLNQSARRGFSEAYPPELAQLERELERLESFLQAWLADSQEL